MSDELQAMRIAILGATSQIAKDLVLSICQTENHELHLFARRPEAVHQWLTAEKQATRCSVADYKAFTADECFDAIINFVGAGDPAKTAGMGASILDVTQEYDSMVLEYLQHHPACRYIFLSSGAAYGSSFDVPVGEESSAVVAINRLGPQDWYVVAKLYAECRHRALSQYAIVDVRVFNYYSHTMDISARFLICDIVRAIRSGAELQTNPVNIVRDFIGPADFHQLIARILSAGPVNTVVDCYTQAPVDKMSLLEHMAQRFGLKYRIGAAPAGVNATGTKTNYYSTNRRAEIFGYQPAKSSLDTVLDEAQMMLDETSKQGQV